MLMTPLRFAACAILRASACVVASGFSHNTCFPALIAARDTGACSPSGVTTDTASISAWASISATEVNAWGTLNVFENCFTAFWLTSQAAFNLTPLMPAYARPWVCPIPPVPMTPILIISVSPGFQIHARCGCGEN